MGHFRKMVNLFGSFYSQYYSTQAEKSGIDIFVKANTRGESVHFKVIITEEGLTDLVYNTFYIGKMLKF